MNAASTILADLARLLRSHGWKVSPPAKSAAAIGNPCPTCGHRREPSVRDRLRELVATEILVDAVLLREVSGCSLGTANNELSWAAQDGLIERVGRGVYRLTGKGASRAG